MGPAGGILTDLIFYVISGVLVSVIADRHKFPLSFLIAVAAPIAPEYFSIVGISLATYLFAASDCLLAVFAGTLLGTVAFRRFADVTSNEHSI
jgi:hypothetical protein